MIRILEFLAIAGFAGLGFIGIQIARGGRKAAIAVSVLVSLVLLFFNAKLEEETGRGFVGNAYCTLVSCNNARDESTDPLAPDLEPTVENRRRMCVTAAMVTISGEPQDNASVLSRMNGADITPCPADFAQEFVGLRQRFFDAVEFERNVEAHRQQGDQAVAGGLAVSFAEWLTDSDSGVTPFSDWVQRDTQLNDQAQAISNGLRDQFDILERSAVGYGVDLNPRASSSGAARGKDLYVVLVSGDDPQGNPIYAFVGVPSERVVEFMTAQRSGALFYPEDYGEVLAEGNGVPSEEVFSRMEREYGFDRQGMSSFH